MSTLTRKYISIINKYNEECAKASEEALKTIVEIASLGDGFENKGATLRHHGGGEYYYVLAHDPSVEAIDNASKEAAETDTDDAKIEVLVRYGILLQLKAT